MHLFPYFTPSTPCCMCFDRWRAKQGWDGDVMVWRSVKCKFARGRSFFRGVKIMGCGSGARAKVLQWCQVKCKLYCNSRTVMPKIIIISSLSSAELDGTYPWFGHILVFLYLGRCQVKCNSHHETAQQKLRIHTLQMQIIQINIAKCTLVRCR